MGIERNQRYAELGIVGVRYEMEGDELSRIIQRAARVVSYAGVVGQWMHDALLMYEVERAEGNIEVGSVLTDLYRNNLRLTEKGYLDDQKRDLAIFVPEGRFQLFGFDDYSGVRVGLMRNENRLAVPDGSFVEVSGPGDMKTMMYHVYRVGGGKQTFPSVEFWQWSKGSGIMTCLRPESEGLKVARYNKADQDHFSRPDIMTYNGAFDIKWKDVHGARTFVHLGASIRWSVSRDNVFTVIDRVMNFEPVEDLWVELPAMESGDS